LANLFSIEYCRDNGHGTNWSADVGSYTAATDLSNQLLHFDRDIIKKLRSVQPTISLIDKDLWV